MSDISTELGPVIGTLAHLAHAEDGGRLSKIRLVKFLYLLDIYWAQSESRTYTQWPWAFVHYGPYCRESTNAIDAAEKHGFVAAESYESSYKDEDFKLYSPGSRVDEHVAQGVLDRLPLHVGSSLHRAVKRWHDDTYDLLDYVYFNTAPMKSAKPGERLSFDAVRMPDYAAFRPVKMLPVTAKNKRALRNVLSNMPKETGHVDSPDLYDSEYQSFVSGVAGPETPTGWSGVAELRFEEPPADD